jgi:UDP-glucose 4-epimerase
VTEPDGNSSFSVAVTGANGFIGTHLVNALTRQGLEVVVLSRSKPTPGQVGVRWVEWSAESEWPVHQIGRIQTVYHLAASTSTDIARSSPEATMQTNALSVLRIVDQLRHLNYQPKIISVGSITELKSARDGTLSDESPNDPGTFYDVSKVTQRMLLDQCVLEGWVDAVSILLPNVYGYWAGVQAKNRGFLNSAIRSAINGQDLTYFDDAEYMRDFLHVDDTVDAMLRASQTSNLSRTSYVIGTGVGIPIHQALRVIADVVRQKTGTSVRVSPSSPPRGHYAIEKRNAKVLYAPFAQDVGWSPKISLRDGIALTVDQYLVNQLI